MPAQTSSTNDLKTAAVLAGCAGLLGAAAVPFLLPPVLERLPEDQRTLPLPLPLFCVVLAVQILVVYGLLGWAGMRLARARGREPAPVLGALWEGRVAGRGGIQTLRALGTGVLCGFALLGAIELVRRVAPQSLPGVLHPHSAAGALLASGAAAFGEEILCRLFLCSALLRLLPPSRHGIIAAVATSSILFGALHAPAAVFLFGGLRSVPALFWLWMISLNALIGAACAAWFLRAGIGAAISLHFAANLVWHVFSRWV